MLKPTSTRRRFLLGAGALSGLGVLGHLPFTSRARADDPPVSTGRFVRRNAHAPEAQADLGHYAAAVQAMKDRDAADPTSWAFQANMHATFETPQAPMAQELWNGCEHGTLFFLAWHRMFLHFFEQIARAASDPAFALPYWKYETDLERVLPKVFRLPANEAANPLYTPKRDKKINGGSPLQTSTTSHAEAFSDAQISFAPPSEVSLGFSSTLEGQPHGTVHTSVGGSDPQLGPGLMTQVPTAAQDPIFWLHHANIDRLWKRWLDLGHGRRNPTDAQWLNQPYAFVDPGGQKVRMTVKEILDTATQGLNYVYDDDPTPTAVAAVNGGHEGLTAMASPASHPTSQPVVVMAASTQPAIKLTQAAVRVAAPLSTQGAQHIQALATGAPPAAPRRLVLRLEGLAADQAPGANFEVYLNLPANVTQPTPEDAHYVGTISFFGAAQTDRPAGHAHHGEPTTRAIDVTKAVQALSTRGEITDGNLQVTLIPQQEAGATQPADRRIINPTANPVIGKISVVSQ